MSILQFDFKSENNLDQSLVFIQPVEIISTRNISEVENCIEQIQQAVNDGFYVAGYLSYEVVYSLTSLKEKSPPITMPLIWFGVFKEPSTLPQMTSKPYTLGEWHLQQTKDDYWEAFHRIKEAIRNDVTNQVNYTVQFQADFHGNSGYSLYKELKKNQRANYSAYLDIGEYEILSASPELFFHVHNNQITTKPMKGTIHRGKTYEEDLVQYRWLKRSEKNRQENDLITSLMVDELKNVAKESSIHVSNQYEIEKYPTVFQMTSTITGEILPGKSIVDIMKTLFPCGSITGVPKQKTIELISNIEKQPREIYCGAIGYITPNQEAIFNVPIRTVCIDKSAKKAAYGAGGAITLYSTPDEEYTEIFTKTKILHVKQESFQLLETFGLKNGRYIAFSEHLQRLQKSASYFDFTINLEKIKCKLINMMQKLQKGQWRVRLLVNESGQCDIEIHPLTKPDILEVSLAESPIDKQNIFLYHKTTNRKMYEIHKKEGVFDTLLWNTDREITEFTIGNIVIELDGELVTPPIECGLLPGTFRKKLLTEKKVKEAKISIEDLNKCTNIWLINSVREWVPVQLQQSFF